MSLTIELPRPLDKELTEEAQREGVSTTDHATLLLYLANALISEDKPTPFKEAVRGFLAHSNLDADRVAAVFEALVAFCLYDAGKASATFQQALTDALTNENFVLLTQWRNSVVHHGMDVNMKTLLSSTKPVESLMQRPGRLNRSAENTTANSEEKEAARIAAIKAAQGSMAHIGVSVDDLHRERQRDKEKEEDEIRRYQP